jgi:hypothetical protein
MRTVLKTVGILCLASAPITAGLAGYGVASGVIHPIAIGILCAACALGFMIMLWELDDEVEKIQRRLN